MTVVFLSIFEQMTSGPGSEDTFNLSMSLEMPAAVTVIGGMQENRRGEREGTLSDVSVVKTGKIVIHYCRCKFARHTVIVK